MAITVSEDVNAATGTTTATAPSALALADGDYVLLLVCSKSSTNAALTTPTNWNLLGAVNVGTGSFAADTGPVRLSAYWRGPVTAAGFTYPSFAPAGTTPSVSVGTIVIRPTAGETVNFEVVTGSDTTSGAAWSVTGSGTLAYAAGDLAITSNGVGGDGPTFGTPTLAATGATFGSQTSAWDVGTASGNDQRNRVDYWTVTAGPASAEPVFTSTMSGNATALGQALGGAQFIRVYGTGGTTSKSGSDEMGALTTESAVLTRSSSTTDTLGGTTTETAAVARSSESTDTLGGLTTEASALAVIDEKTGSDTLGGLTTETASLAATDALAATDDLGGLTTETASLARTSSTTDDLGGLTTETAGVARSSSATDDLGGLTTETAGLGRTSSTTDDLGGLTTETALLSEAKAATDDLGGLTVETAVVNDVTAKTGSDDLGGLTTETASLSTTTAKTGSDELGGLSTESSALAVSTGLSATDSMGGLSTETASLVVALTAADLLGGLSTETAAGAATLTAVDSIALVAEATELVDSGNYTKEAVDGATLVVETAVLRRFRYRDGVGAGTPSVPTHAAASTPSTAAKPSAGVVTRSSASAGTPVTA